MESLFIVEQLHQHLSKLALKPGPKGLFTLKRVGLSPKAQVVPRLEDEGHWKRGTFSKARKLEMGCGSNFRYKFKKKGHGPLSKLAEFLSGVIHMNSI
jgi:hypothetical protein